MDKKRVVVVGGGTGTHTVLRGLRRYSDEIDITAIVNMSDSGGSTGRLRDEFGQLPVGDVRNVLTALAADDDEHYNLLRKLFLYRFDRGEGLLGHNFGNLLLTALTDILGDEVKAIEAASKILRVSGRVVPVTTDNVNLVAEYEDGSVVFGESDIDTLSPKLSQLRIIKLSLTPEASLNPSAREALVKADLIVLGPGDLYTSILSNCVVNGFPEALAESKAKIVYVCNLMSKKGQTVGMNAMEHINEVIRYINMTPDIAIINSNTVPEDILENYAKEGDHPVVNNCTSDKCMIYAEPLVAEEIIQPVSGDVVKRSLVRHDPDRLAAVLMKLI
jgi:uncharacterized cofD-like protein